MSSPLAWPLAGTQSLFTQEWSGDRKETPFLYISKTPKYRNSWTVAPKLIGEALTWATFTLKEYENVRIDEIIKTGIYNSLYVKKVLPAFTDCASFIRLPNRSRRCASLGSRARRLPGLLKLLAAGAETLEGSSLSALPCPRDCLTLPDILSLSQPKSAKIFERI